MVLGGFGPLIFIEFFGAKKLNDFKALANLPLRKADRRPAVPVQKSTSAKLTHNPAPVQKRVKNYFYVRPCVFHTKRKKVLDTLPAPVQKSVNLFFTYLGVFSEISRNFYLFVDFKA